MGLFYNSFADIQLHVPFNVYLSDYKWIAGGREHKGLKAMCYFLLILKAQLPRKGIQSCQTNYHNQNRSNGIYSELAETLVLNVLASS